MDLVNLSGGWCQRKKNVTLETNLGHAHAERTEAFRNYLRSGADEAGTVLVLVLVLVPYSISA